MSPWVILVLLSLSSHRVTRVITRDYFPPVRIIREAIDRKLGAEHWLAYLTQCDWCAGIWVASGLTTALALFVALDEHESWWPWPVWILFALAAASITGLVAQHEPDDE